MAQILSSGSHIAVHAEDPIGNDQGALVGAFVFVDQAVQVVRIGMGVAHDARPGKARPVDDAGVVQLVREDHVFLADQSLDGSQVGGKTGLKADGGFDALEGRQAAFELAVNFHRSGDGAHCRRADPVLGNDILDGFHHPGVVGQAKIVVRAEIEHAFAVHHQVGALGRTEGADAVEQSSLFQAIELLLHPIQSIAHFFLFFGENFLIFEVMRVRAQHLITSNQEYYKSSCELAR